MIVHQRRILASCSGSFRMIGSASALAKEYYYSNADFSIVNRDSLEGSNVFDYRNRGLYDRRTPIVAVPAKELNSLSFLSDEAKMLFLSNAVVDIPASRGINFGREAYVRDWIHRLKHKRKAVVLPEIVDSFFAPPAAGDFVLTGPVQEFVINHRLDTALYDILAKVRNAGSTRIVYHIGIVNILPPIVRLININIDKHVSRFEE
jgi:hypothetical protein